MRLESLDIPTAKINQLTAKNINTVEDLVRLFPKKYFDFRSPVKLSEAKPGEYQAFVGKMFTSKHKNKKSYINAGFTDNSGQNIFVSWFNMPYIENLLHIQQQYFIAGKIEFDHSYGLTMINPMIITQDIEEYKKIVPQYSKIKGMGVAYFEKLMKSAIALAVKHDYLEPVLQDKYDLLKLSHAIHKIHHPQTMEDIDIAKKRFLFDDLFIFGLQMKKNAMCSSTESNFKFKTIGRAQEFIRKLPFDLTKGQSEALNHMHGKLFSGKRVHSLIQGDVGAGKTIVAIVLMLMTAENGFQSALMAPTTVLAKQHYLELKELMEPYGFCVGYLSGELKAKEKREVLEKLKEGQIHMVIGTHAVISKDVVFKNLAMTIVDEEHRFGVAQRHLLQVKAEQGVHNVSMSATPIPRTMALTIYGDDVDVLTIKSLPKGRLPIKTVQVKSEFKAYEGMYRQIKEGRQCYIICSLIEDSEHDALKKVDSVETTFKKVTEFFKPHPEIKIGVINGKMKQKDVVVELEKFSNKEYDIIISTTIIEVGVNIPNTTVMLIKDANRFGLSQLHQLRGRVGRSSFQSFCVLQHEKQNTKLDAMVSTTDGFEIAKKDLELRGMGDFIGTKQSGDNKYVMLMIANEKLYTSIKEDIKAIYGDERRKYYYSHLNDEDITTPDKTVKKVN